MIYTEYTKASSFTMLPFGMINEVEMLVNSEAGLVVIAKKKKKKTRNTLLPLWATKLILQLY